LEERRLKGEEAMKRTMDRSATLPGSTCPVESTPGLGSRASPTPIVAFRESESEPLLASPYLFTTRANAKWHFVLLSCRFSVGGYLFLTDLSSIHANDQKIDIIYDLTYDYDHLLTPLEHEPGEENEIILPSRLMDEFFGATSIFRLFPNSDLRRLSPFTRPEKENDADIDFLDIVGRIVVEVGLDEETTFYEKELGMMLDRLEERCMDEGYKELMAKMATLVTVTPANPEKGLAKAREVVFVSKEGKVRRGV
jgi:hypothetical protein